MILDASALLAFVHKEPGWREIQPWMVDERAKISAVNMAEVAGKLYDDGLFPAGTTIALDYDLDVLPFGMREIAYLPMVREATRPFGLSLADRCCLAAGLAHGEGVLTADRIWKRIRIRGLEITLVRGSGRAGAGRDALPDSESQQRGDA